MPLPLMQSSYGATATVAHRHFETVSLVAAVAATVAQVEESVAVVAAAATVVFPAPNSSVLKPPLLVLLLAFVRCAMEFAL